MSTRVAAEAALGLVAMRTGGAARVLRAGRPAIPILTYHHVAAARRSGEPTCLELAGMSTPLRCFRAQMEYVARHCHTVRLADVVDWMAGGPDLPDGACALTFDDGYLDTYRHAVPVLEALGLAATFFVICGPLVGEESWLHEVYRAVDRLGVDASVRALAHRGGGAPTERLSKRRLRRWLKARLRDSTRAARDRMLAALRDVDSDPAGAPPMFVGAGEVADLAARGFDVGAHSVRHEYLDRLDDDAAERDVAVSRAALEAVLPAPPRLFCYPFGEAGTWDVRTVAALRRHGFAGACTSIGGANARDTSPFELRRIDVSCGVPVAALVWRMIRSTRRSRRGVS